MDLNLLSLFVVVAEASSFTTAAEKLGVKRSSVSRGVAALERELGVQLFSRTTRHVALTTAGTALYAKVGPQLASLKQTLGTLPEREQEPSGELRITAPNDMGAFLLPSIVAGFTLRHPGVRVDVRLSDRRVDLVGEGFDAALRVGLGKQADSTVVMKRLANLETQVFAAPSYLARAGTPRTIEDARDHEWILHSTIRSSRAFPFPTPAKHHVLGDTVLFMFQAAKAGAGLAFLPTFLAREDVAAGRLVRVMPRFSAAAGTLYLAHPAATHVPRKVTAFRDYIVEYLAAYPL